MGVPTSEVDYTPAMPRREDHEVHKAMWWHWTKKYILIYKYKKIFTCCNHTLNVLIKSKEAPPPPVSPTQNDFIILYYVVLENSNPKFSHDSRVGAVNYVYVIFPNGIYSFQIS